MSQSDASMFEHYNLNEIDTSYKPVPEGVYTFEVNSLQPAYRKITKESSAYFGQEVLIFRGSFTIVDDENYSSRKIWQEFWTTNKYNLIELKKLSDATGHVQADGQSLKDFAESFATLDPPAKFQCFTVVESQDWKGNPIDPPQNVIRFVNAKPV